MGNQINDSVAIRSTFFYFKFCEMVRCIIFVCTTIYFKHLSIGSFRIKVIIVLEFDCSFLLFVLSHNRYQIIATVSCFVMFITVHSNRFKVYECDFVRMYI
jgi:hypothetical protein